MTKDEERAREQYKTNPLAKVFVDTLCQQIEIPPTAGSALMILAHRGLLDMLELGQASMERRIVLEKLNPTPPVKEVWLPK